MSSSIKESDVIQRIEGGKITLMRRLSQFLFTFCMVHYMFYLWIILGVFYVLCTAGYGTIVVIMIAAYLPSYLDNSSCTGGRPWHAFRKSPLWILTIQYYGLQMIRQEKLDPNKKYVFGYYPHGILILSRVSSYGGIWEKLFPGIETRILAASALLKCPGVREVCLWMGAVDASRKSAEEVLKKGLSVIVYPGGSKEIFTTNPNSKKTKIILKERKGFIKLAIQQGAEIVPTFVFGEKWMYNMWRPPRFIWKAFLRVFRVPIIVFWGKFCTLMPFRKPMGIVYGKPLAVQQNDTPSDEEVDALHIEYIKAIETIFHDYKDYFNYDVAETLEIQ